MSKVLEWNVFVEDFNAKCIKTYNILNSGIVKEIIKRTKSISDKEQFSNEIRSILMYHYWSKAEWEIIITDWPAHVAVEDVYRLVDDIEDHEKRYGSKPYSVAPKLRVSEKIDAYKQVRINWGPFIDYLWKELKTDA